MHSIEIYEIKTIIITLLFNLTKQVFINNPILLSEKPNPLFLYNNSKYIIFTSGESLEINRITGEIENRYDFINYSKPYILCTDESNNHFIFSKGKYYKILSTNTVQEISLPNIKFPDNSNYIGFIKESQYEGPNSLEEGKLSIGHTCQIKKNEIIIYGKKGSNNLVFSFISQAYSKEFYISGNFEEKISCQIYQHSIYLCFFMKNKQLYYNVYVYATTTNDLSNSKCELKQIGLNYFAPLMTNKTWAETYNTNKIIDKRVCFKSLNNLKIECIYYTLSVKETYDNTTGWKYNIGQNSYKINPHISFPTESNNNKDWHFIYFSSYHFNCVGGTNIIQCSKVNANSLIKKFILDIPGQNTNIYLFSSDNYLLTLFYMNTIDSKDKIYAYYIYNTNCKSCFYDNNLYFGDYNTGCSNGFYNDITNNLNKICKCENSICLSLPLENNNLCFSYNNKDYYPIYNDSSNIFPYINCYHSPEGFYFEKNITKYKPCYFSCKSCSNHGDAKNNNCTECLDNFSFKYDFIDDTNCYKILL